jgi:hypothetical protein
MADKVQTGISITKEAHHIVKEYADERGLNFSAALEVVIMDWHNSTRIQAAQMAQWQERIAETPGLVAIVPEGKVE